MKYAHYDSVFSWFRQECKCFCAKSITQINHFVPCKLSLIYPHTIYNWSYDNNK